MPLEDHAVGPSSFEHSTLYAELDALLDTRLAVLKTFGLDVVEQNLKSTYHLREVDEFIGVDPEQYRERYLNRDAKILKDAILTPTWRIINHFTVQTLKALAMSPYRRQPKLVLNLYPYILDKSSITMIISGIRAVTRRLIDIEIIYAPNSVITPDHVRSNYAQVVMYAYWEWLEEHAKSKRLLDEQCPAVTFVGPRLYQSSEAQRKLKGQDAFEVIEDYAKFYVKLELVPIYLYCIDMKRYLDWKKPQS